jgi:hypothetical protein
VAVLATGLEVKLVHCVYGTDLGDLNVFWSGLV